MQVTVNKSEPKGSVKVPSSKSQTIRALMCAALSKGESVLENPLVCEDTDAAADVLGKVGIDIQRGDGTWRVLGGTFRAPSEDLYCGESATTLRFMTAICSIIPGKCRLVGGPSLSKRPVRSLVEALGKLGVTCSLDGKTTSPVSVEGSTLRGGTTELPGHISSQFISALLLVAPFAKKEVSIRLTSQLTSRPYLLMTTRCLKKFGINVSTSFDKYVVPRQTYRATQFPVEGDWSSAAYFLAMGALSEGIKVENISTTSVQGDRVILDILRNMGVKVRVAGDSVSVSKGELKAVHADLSDCIDLLPTVAVLAALAEGTSEFTGIERARIKESDRVAAVREGLGRIGVTVHEERNKITVTGLATKKPADEEKEEESGEDEKSQSGGAAEEKREPVTIDSRKDHRIAMAFAILGCALGDITITDAECVAKTYPGFWESLKNIGGKVETHE
ncbi:MAG TPA: 3-phosphoshikimate 1-carboxyvinyltransferase [Dehalococcoidia bacterium]|nr:3-phosphoshikimate 1-carboxyvinyltransferase [Dehalococcoidia bacterium]